jgi:UDPglucose 6-dehydrogenase
MKSLAAEHGAEDCVPRAFIDHSRSRRDWALRQVHRQVLSRHTDPVVAIWGLAYKVNTKSVKNSPTLALLDGLPGVAVRLYDPAATLGAGYPTATQVTSPLAACQGAHALVIMTAWDEFASIPLGSVTSALAAPIVIDPAGSWRTRAVAAASIHYSTLGRPPGTL